MRLNEALENERKRSLENASIIFLHKEGKFYRAYEWSAWLIKTVTCTEEMQKERHDDKILVVNHRKCKIGDYIMVGFPLESISKFIPNQKEVEAEGDMLVIELENPFEDCNFDSVSEEFELWRTLIPIEDNQKTQKDRQNTNTPVLAKSGLFQIVSRVLSYQVAKKTPTENFDFICELQGDIAKLL